MSTMFDRLGKKLSQCLESGEFPSKKKEASTNEACTKVIPLELRKEFELFGYERIIDEEQKQLAQVPDFSDIRAKYASLIKQIHPDTASSSLNKDTVAFQLEKITVAFNKLKKWYQENQ
ncbi:MAG: hypothetical protein J6B81_02140 [Spirochaetaceae bacterium]|nr:hypothetical protein [Spirochaetaceae bacterium]